VGVDLEHHLIVGGLCHVVEVNGDHRKKRQILIIARVPKQNDAILLNEFEHLTNHLPHPRECNDVVEESKLQEYGNSCYVLCFGVLPKDLSVNWRVYVRIEPIFGLTHIY
jgi:hypothetical protein